MQKIKILHALCIALVSVGLWLTPAHAEPNSPVDYVIATGVDGSGSFQYWRHRQWMRALAKVLADPELQSLMTQGRHGRTQFMVYRWGSPEYTKLVVNQTLSGPEDFAALQVRLYDYADNDFWPVTNTDASAGLQFGVELIGTHLQSGVAGKSVLNLVTDDDDARTAILPAQRELAVELGITVSVLNIEGGALNGLYEQTVITGPGAFVMSVGDGSTPESMASMMDAWKRKFLRDLLM